MKSPLFSGRQGSAVHKKRWIVRPFDDADTACVDRNITSMLTLGHLGTSADVVSKYYATIGAGITLYTQAGHVLAAPDEDRSALQASTII